MTKLTKTFELDQVLEEDENLRKKIQRKVVKLHKRDSNISSGVNTASASKQVSSTNSPTLASPHEAVTPNHSFSDATPMY